MMPMLVVGCATQRPVDAHQGSEQCAGQHAASKDLAGDALVNQIEELRDADEERDAVFVERLHDALRRNTR